MDPPCAIWKPLTEKLMLKSDLSLQYLLEHLAEATKQEQTLWRNTFLPPGGEDFYRKPYQRWNSHSKNYKTYKDIMQQEQQAVDKWQD